MVISNLPFSIFPAVVVGIIASGVSSVFVAQGIIREVPLEKAFNAVWWFIFCQLITLVLFVAFPQIITFLPERMRAG